MRAWQAQTSQNFRCFSIRMEIFNAFDVFEFQILPTAADLDWK